jgi:ATP-dependent Zn protease
MITQKYLKQLVKLGLEEKKAKSFLFDLEADLSKNKDNVETQNNINKDIFNKFSNIEPRNKLYFVMLLVMIIFLIWIFMMGDSTTATTIVQNTSNLSNISQNLTLENVINTTNFTGG